MNEAAAWGDYERVTSLLEEGAPTNNTDYHNRTPIDWIVTWGKDAGKLGYSILDKTSWVLILKSYCNRRTPMVNFK